MIGEIIKSVPYKVGEQILYEYNRRISDINYLVSGKFSYYTPLSKDIETIKVLLALSIFYKRVLTNFDSANKFTSRVIKSSDATGVKLGTYEMDWKEIQNLNRMVLSFRRIALKYYINPEMFEYIETKEFLRKIKSYKKFLEEIKEDGESI
ncbi:MAG: hypothetical protein JNM71_14710 [Flavobacterium lindanitolerans]|uniref:hypothetical protein n=1 Tax=Flavobacterium lindanitolerans TaxID=428988 RepID=UPI001A583A8C|nr:hypothetical protein [Flavobacterium lindanitolerans]MBL7869265.1 hypothetical protein [Flavobacterium lindanitolerans]